MSEESPKLVQLNLLVEDMGASLDFYRRLGLATADEEGEPHVELSMPGGLSLELDTAESARLWHAGIRADPASGRAARVVIGFSLPSRAAVDTGYAELTAADTRADSRRSTRSGAAGTPSWPTPAATTSR